MCTEDPEVVRRSLDRLSFTATPAMSEFMAKVCCGTNVTVPVTHSRFCLTVTEDTWGENEMIPIDTMYWKSEINELS